MHTIKTGKLAPAVMQSLLDAGPPLPREVVVGPSVGEDGCAIEVAAGTLVAATDPITLTGSDVGAHAVRINANDVAVMGVRPRWFLATVLLPPGTLETEIRALFASMHDALDQTGAALVGGHTEVTAAVTQPLVVGQMLGIAEDGHIVRTGGARPGERIVQIGPAPVEGTAVLAEARTAQLRGLHPDQLARARAALGDPGISVVKPALLATELGASALHDPTESGLSGGLYELAWASGTGIKLRRDAVLWFEPGLAVCQALGADPWGVLASGALLAAFPAQRSADALGAFSQRGWLAAEIGIVTRASGVYFEDHTPLARFERDEVARVLG